MSSTLCQHLMLFTIRLLLSVCNHTLSPSCLALPAYSLTLFPKYLQPHPVPKISLTLSLQPHPVPKMSNTLSMQPHPVQHSVCPISFVPQHVSRSLSAASQCLQHVSSSGPFPLITPHGTSTTQASLFRLSRLTAIIRASRGRSSHGLVRGVMGSR